MSDHDGLIEAVLTWMETASRVFALLTVPLLVVAVLLRARRSGKLLGAPSPRALACMVGLGVAIGFGVVVGALLDMPRAVGPLELVLVVLLAVLLMRDERFWAITAILAVVFTAIGTILLIGMSYNFEQIETGGRWLGGRQLVAWGGLKANPTYDHWEWTVASLAILRYGVPLALTVAIGWLLATRTGMSRIERLGLLLASGTFLAAAVGGAALSIVEFSAGVLLGVPLGLAIAGVVGSVITLLTVGPGAVGGALVGGRSLASRVPSSPYAFVSSLGTVRDAVENDAAAGHASGDRGVVRSLLHFLRGNFGRTQRIYLGLVGLLTIGVVLGAMGIGILKGDEEPVAVRFQSVAAEVGVGFGVRSAHPGPNGAVWLVGRDGQLLSFDPASGRIHDTGVRSSATAHAGTTLHALTTDEPARIVALDAGGVQEWGVLPVGLTGQIEIQGDTAYVASADGRLVRLDRATGQIVAETSGTPVIDVVARPGELWTVHRPANSLLGEFEATLRDPVSLEASVEQPPLPFDDVLIAAAGNLWLSTPFLAATYLGDGVGHSFPDLPESEDARFLESDASDTVWRSLPFGRVDLLSAGGTSERYDFHYDTILAVVATPTGTWIVADNDRGVVVDTHQEYQSYVVRWDNAPVHLPDEAN